MQNGGGGGDTWDAHDFVSEEPDRSAKLSQSGQHGRRPLGSSSVKSGTLMIVTFKHHAWPPEQERNQRRRSRRGGVQAEAACR